MLWFFKKLFGIKEKCCCEYTCDCKKSTYNNPDLKDDCNEIISRRGYNIILPYDIEQQLTKENILISATKYKDNPSCVQLFKTINGRSKYIGTLKTYMNVKSFKDGNVCNFSRNNLIYKE